MSKRVALLTGATGFVGSNLTRFLVREGWRVHVLLRSELPEFSSLSEVFGKLHPHYYDGSTGSVLQCFEEAEPDIVFHLSSLYLAQHKPQDIIPLIQSNILLGAQVLEGMAGSRTRLLVNAGTSWQHYNDEEYNPVCLYAATKEAFEAILTYYVEAHGVRAITLKLFDTFGPNDRRKKLFHLLRNAAAGGEQLAMSPGKQLLDLVYIDDVVQAFAVAGKRLRDGKVKGSESYALSSGNPVTLKSIAGLYGRIAKKKLNILWGGRPYRDREVMVPWTKGKKLPDWSPTVTLEEGIRKLVSLDQQ
ncbi:MAG TPA: NAD(P)-dependent oxidoreductase [Bacteroidota bacterium]